MAADVGVAERLRWARKRAGFVSAADAARRLGVSIPTYVGHENASRGVKNKEAQRYSSTFRVSYDWLMTGRGEPTARPPRHVELFEALNDHNRQSVLVFMEMLLAKQRPD